MTLKIPSEPKWSRVPASGKQINTCAITPDGSRVVCGTWVERGADKGIFSVYCYDASGELLWSAPVSDTPIEHGVYWVDISDDGSTVAAGGEVSYGSGFLTAYQYCPGAPDTERLRPLLDASTSSRINQVSLSADGSCLVACYGNSIALFARSAQGGFTQLDSHDAGANAEVKSAMVDGAGTRAVLASRTYDSSGGTTGQLISFEIGPDGFASTTTTPFDSGVMRVAITDDGSAWGGSLHDGSCVCFHNGAERTPAWRYHPKLNVELAYGFGISGPDASTVNIALGANMGPTGNPGPGFHPGGGVFSLTSVGSNGSYAPQCNWVIPTSFGVNPGVSLDRAGAFVTATDGKPNDKNKLEESAGHFYLFDNAAGSIVWSRKTETMNWPMAIAGDGRAIVGGSDDGRLFYWAAD